MSIRHRLTWLLHTLLICFILPTPIIAAEIPIAAAANFATPLERLAPLFEKRSGHQLAISLGSTGKHYAQIRNGAPFNVFLAADVTHPQRLEAEGLAVPKTRFTYALGKLVLWSPQLELVDDKGIVLKKGDFAHLAIANPRTAPYGVAAEQVLRNLDLWETLQPRLVKGENIGQTYQFVASDAAELGFIALSQIKMPDKQVTGSVWQIPATLYAPIEQQAVLLRDNAPARQFLAFLRSDTARELIGQFGYDLPSAIDE